MYDLDHSIVRSVAVAQLDAVCIRTLQSRELLDIDLPTSTTSNCAICAAEHSKVAGIVTSGAEMAG